MKIYLLVYWSLLFVLFLFANANGNKGGNRFKLFLIILHMIALGALLSI